MIIEENLKIIIYQQPKLKAYEIDYFCGIAVTKTGCSFDIESESINECPLPPIIDISSSETQIESEQVPDPTEAPPRTEPPSPSMTPSNNQNNNNEGGGLNDETVIIIAVSVFIVVLIL